MSYLFPKRVLRSTSITDPVPLTEDFSPPADMASGKLNAHNFSTAIGPAVDVDYEAFYSVSPFWAFVPFEWSGSSPGAFGYPDGTTLNGAMLLIQNTFEWQTLNQGGAPMSIEVDTGTSVLWINAYVQYLWFGFNPSFGDPFTINVLSLPHRNGAGTNSVNLQFALRVNGNVIPETITGVEDTTYRASVPIKPEDPTEYGILPGPQDLLGRQICALGPPCLPIRLGACVPVQPGHQTIEVVCRRIPASSTGYGSYQFVLYGQYDYIYLYSRQMHVTELKMAPVDSVASFEVTVPAFEEEEPLSSSSLYTQRLQPIVTAYNNLTEGALQRGALMHSQLPSTLLNSATVERTLGTAIYNNFFPGHNDDTVTTTGYAGAPATGWKLLADNSNANAVVVENFTVDRACTLLILANVQITNVVGDLLRDPADPTTEGANFASFALFKLMFQYASASSTDWTGIESSTGMVNNFVWWPRFGEFGSGPPAVGYGIENVEVPLMGIFSFVAPPTEPINIGIFGGVANSGTSYIFERGSIVVLAYRY